MRVPNIYWTKEDVRDAYAAQSFEALAVVAVRILSRMEKVGTVIQVCGPITTGGCGCEVRNRARLRAAIEIGIKYDYIIFDQTPFGEHIRRISTTHSCGDYDKSILHIFFREIFASRHILEIWILPGSEESEGVRWEIAEAKKRDIKIRGYPEHLLPDLELVA